MTDWEEYYLDRLISEYSFLDVYESILADIEKRCAALEQQIINIFGEEKADEIYEKAIEWKNRMKGEK